MWFQEVHSLLETEVKRDKTLKQEKKRHELIGCSDFIMCVSCYLPKIAVQTKLYNTVVKMCEMRRILFLYNTEKPTCYEIELPTKQNDYRPMTRNRILFLVLVVMFIS